jgi:2,4'-dihydroxyacetophenone dioxygenase
VFTLFILGAALQYFDEDNQIVGQDDIYTVLYRYRDFCETNGLSIREDLLEQL